MAGYFRKTTVSSDGVGKLKYSADYSSLQDAVDDLASGDTLFINSDYTLTSTVNINIANVNIFGKGCTIRPSSNGSPSPLIRVRNTSSQPSVYDLVIGGLSLKSAGGTEEGYGSGTAIEIIDQYPNANDGWVWHVKLEDLNISNFAKAVLIEGAFDVVVNNCNLSQNEVGLRCETLYSDRITGQVKVFGGFLLENHYHLSLDGASGTEVDDLYLFGVTMGGQRDHASGGSIGVYVGKSTGGIFLFGCHLEDLASGIYEASSVYIASVSIFGSKLLTISGAGVDTSDGSGLGSISLIGNSFQTSNNGVLYKAQSTLHGALIGGNLRSSGNVEPAIGLLEHSPADSKSAFRIPTFSDSSRPSAGSMPAGSLIRNSTSNKLNVSDGTNWRDANGNIV